MVGGWYVAITSSGLSIIPPDSPAVLVIVTGDGRREERDLNYLLIDFSLCGQDLLMSCGG